VEEAFTLIISAGIVTPADHLFAGNETSSPDRQGLLPLQDCDTKTLQ
jgi:uncharacterized membrane protein